ncbi:MAG: N-acetyl-alpha-D-glucosaminyl L-malate synthase BshA [Bacteroidota bacterium]
MNIGIVCYPTYGGSGVVATELGKSLAGMGHEVHFITYNRPIRLDSFFDQIFYHEVRTKDYPLFDFVPYESALSSTMVDVARYHKLDLFHVHYAVPHASVAYLAREILKGYGMDVPVITTLHGTDITLVGKNPSYEPVVKFSMEQSDGITAVSNFLKQATYDFFDIKSSIKVIQNFVDTHRFRPQDKRHFRKMIAKDGEKILIHTSNFRKVKRVRDVLLTFDKVLDEMPAKLLMVGDGPDRKSAEELCRELSICEHVNFLGSQNAVEEIYAVADLFLLPSETESFGLAALEAMACAVPVIASNAGGIPEVVIDGETGFTSRVGNVEKMAKDALYLLEKEERWRHFSDASLRHALQFSKEAIVPQYVTYYEEVMASHESVPYKTL